MLAPFRWPRLPLRGTPGNLGSFVHLRLADWGGKHRFDLLAETGKDEVSACETTEGFGATSC